MFIVCDIVHCLLFQNIVYCLLFIVYFIVHVYCYDIVHNIADNTLPPLHVSRQVLRAPADPSLRAPADPPPCAQADQSPRTPADTARLARRWIRPPLHTGGPVSSRAGGPLPPRAGGGGVPARTDGPAPPGPVDPSKVFQAWQCRPWITTGQQALYCICCLNRSNIANNIVYIV